MLTDSVLAKNVNKNHHLTILANIFMKLRMATKHVEKTGDIAHECWQYYAEYIGRN